MSSDGERARFSDDDDLSPPPSRPSGTLRVLARGNACLCCRRRKLKCDGAKPHCGPCARGRRTNECVYEEAKIKTKTQILQSRIRELEAKMKRMSEREKSSSSPRRRTTLPPNLQPASARPEPQHANSAPIPTRADSTDTTFSDNIWSPEFAFEPVLPNVDVWSNSNQSWLDLLPTEPPQTNIFGLDQLGLTPTVAPSNLAYSISPPSLVNTWEDDVRLSALDLTRQIDIDDVPQDISRELLRVFLRHRRQCFFEVHSQRFVAALQNPPSQRPHPALINAIYLLGCHASPSCFRPLFPLSRVLQFSPNSTYSQYENLFLARTRKAINTSLENADRLLNFLQASVLLAWYFFFKGRLLEGHYHASAAARFAMSCGLHLLKVKADGLQGTLTFYCPSPSQSSDRNILPQPEDSIALAERINLFWSIFLADRTGSIGTGLPVVIRDNEIETPWPRRFEDFELIIWTTVAEALAVEFERLRRLNAEPQLKDMEFELTTLFTAMKELRAVFPILTIRINKVPLFQGCSLEIDYPPCGGTTV
ncbi:hypothetical protein FRB99_007222 [Tulasnella sp. 403]|nr:hypothetical protein FRB99_007222 [Tulasnella sp. 403]